MMMEPTASFAESSASSQLLNSDLENDADVQQRQRNAVQSALDQLGTLLSEADGALDNLEDEDVLGSAIVRGCRDLADAVGHIADKIDDQSDDDRRALAKACIDDAQDAGLRLREEVEEDNRTDDAVVEGASLLQNSSNSNCKNNDNDEQKLLLARELSSMSQDDVVTAIQAAGTLLRDVEATLRAIDQDEADEIADVALTVAHLFVASLQSVQQSLTPDDLLLTAASTATTTTTPGNNNRSATTPQIEILPDDDDEEDEEDGGDEQSGLADAAKRKKKEAVSASTRCSSSKRRRSVDRVRVLWPPLGLAVGDALHWGKDTAQQKPILAVALGITLWPAAVMTAVVCLPVVVMDGIAQDWYNHSQDTPIVECLERSAANIYQTGRLSLLCGKLMGKQTLRVVSRQVQRRGGVEKIARDVGSMALDRVTHPVETISMAWNGLAWSFNMARQAYDNISDQERDDTTLNLQQ